MDSYVSCVFLGLCTGADDDYDMAMDIDVKDSLDIDLRKQITAAFDSNSKLLQNLVC